MRYAALPLSLLFLSCALVTPLLAGTIQYTYDAAGRLTAADYGGGKTILYTYDANGNLLERKVTGQTTDPAPDIQANGSNGPVVVSSGTPVSVTVGLNPGQYAGVTADWWMAVKTPFAAPSDWYTYVYPTGWMPGIHRCAQAGLFEFSGFEVLNMVLPVGNYTFYFALDPPDGIPTAEVMDWVQVGVE